MPFLERDKVDERTRNKLDELIDKSYENYWIKKRLFDIFFASLILLFLLPLMIVVAIVIVIDDPTAGTVLQAAPMWQTRGNILYV